MSQFVSFTYWFPLAVTFFLVYLYSFYLLKFKCYLSIIWKLRYLSTKEQNRLEESFREEQLSRNSNFKCYMYALLPVRNHNKSNDTNWLFKHPVNNLKTTKLDDTQFHIIKKNILRVCELYLLLFFTFRVSLATRFWKGNKRYQERHLISQRAREIPRHPTIGHNEHNCSRVWSRDLPQVFLKAEKLPKDNWERIQHFGLQ